MEEKKNPKISKGQISSYIYVPPRLSSCPDSLQRWTTMGKLNQINPFTPVCFYSKCFLATVVTLTKTVTVSLSSFSVHSELNHANSGSSFLHPSEQYESSLCPIWLDVRSMRLWVKLPFKQKVHGRVFLPSPQTP